MKISIRKTSLIVIIFVLNLAYSIGQITISQSDMPSQGDTIRTSAGINLDFSAVEATGEDFIWDFSQLLSVNQTVDSFVSVLETPIFYWPFFLLSANLASPALGDLPIPNLPLSDVFSFYNNTNNSFQDVGFAATLSGIPLPFKYDSPDILYKFPMQYGNADSSESGYEFGISEIGYILMNRNRVNYVDGWGTLITPFGTFQVLRQRSEVTEYDSIYIDSLNFGLPLNRNYIEYIWLGKGTKIPLLQITSELGGLVAVYIDSLYSETVGIQEQKKLISDYLTIIPNPVSSIFTAYFELEKPERLKIFLFDMKGERVFYQEKDTYLQGKQTLSFDLTNQDLKSGNCILVIQASNKILTAKIIYNP